MMAMARAVLLWTGVVAAVALPAARAWACSPLGCMDPHFYPEEILEIPANVPGPVFFPPIALGQQVTPLDELSFQWLDEEGNPVSHQAVVGRGVVVLVPEFPLRPHAVYTVDYPNDCLGLVQRRTFVASEEAEWPCEVPAVTGTASALESLEVMNFTGSCTQIVVAAVSRIEVQRKNPFHSWVPVLRMRTTVDGALWAFSEPGLLQDGHEPLPINLLEAHGGRRADVLYAFCQGAGGIDAGLEPGTHRVRVEFLLPGHETVVAAPDFDVTLTCDDPGEDVTEGGDDVASCGGGSDGCVATVHPGRDGGLGALWLLVFLVLPRVVARGRRRWRAARVRSSRHAGNG